MSQKMARAIDLCRKHHNSVDRNDSNVVHGATYFEFSHFEHQPISTLADQSSHGHLSALDLGRKKGRLLVLMALLTEVEKVRGPAISFRF